jgi:hypothetical protein
MSGKTLENPSHTTFKEYKIDEDSHIAFGFNYNGGEHDEIIVSNITSIRKENGIRTFLCHFLYGHHSLSEFIKEQDVLAIGHEDGVKLRGWRGKFKILKETELLKQNLE